MATTKLLKSLTPLFPSLNLPKYSSSISFSSNGEDYRTEYACLDYLNSGERARGKDKNHKILTIVGGSDNIASLLCRDDVSTIHGIDMNESQIRLCDVKLNYGLSLDQKNIIKLLESNYSGWLTTDDFTPTFQSDKNDYRKSIYSKYIMNNNNFVCGIDSDKYWIDRFDNEIANGFIGLSNVDKLFLIFLNNIGENAKLLMNKDVFNGDSIDDDELDALYDMIGKGMKNELVWSIIQSSLPEKVWQSWIPFHQMLFKEYFKQHQYPQKSYFYSFMVDQRCYGGNYPLWLQEKNLLKLKHIGIDNIKKRLRFHNGDYLDTSMKIADRYNYKFDLINTSNIFDWQSVEYATNSIKMLCNKCLNSNGLLITRFAIHALATNDKDERIKAIDNLVKNMDNISINKQLTEKVVKSERGVFGFHDDCVVVFEKK